MNMKLNINLANNYRNNSQKIRVITESWISDYCYCLYCGNSNLNNFENNKPVADFYCSKCNSEYELKSKSGKLSKKISDGAYKTMIERITSNSNPDLLVMTYNKIDYSINDLLLVPKFFFVPSIIEKRKPLALTAKRAGWVGCNILFSEIPKQACIYIIQNNRFIEKELVLHKANINKVLKTDNVNSRGWMLETLRCINKINQDIFYLTDIYEFEPILKLKYFENNNIKAKLRQQLQFLRDKGFIEFLGNGKYKKLI